MPPVSADFALRAESPETFHRESMIFRLRQARNGDSANDAGVADENRKAPAIWRIFCLRQAGGGVKIRPPRTMQAADIERAVLITVHQRHLAADPMCVVW